MAWIPAIPPLQFRRGYFPAPASAPAPFAMFVSSVPALAVFPVFIVSPWTVATFQQCNVMFLLRRWQVQQPWSNSLVQIFLCGTSPSVQSYWVVFLVWLCFSWHLKAWIESYGLSCEWGCKVCRLQNLDYLFPTPASTTPPSLKSPPPPCSSPQIKSEVFIYVKNCSNNTSLSGMSVWQTLAKQVAAL